MFYASDNLGHTNFLVGTGKWLATSFLLTPTQGERVKWLSINNYAILTVYKGNISCQTGTQDDGKRESENSGAPLHTTNRRLSQPAQVYLLQHRMCSVTGRSQLKQITEQCKGE